ncbi:MAG: NAD(P)H-dependent oxidoreductase [Piscinibacter sp.]|nr:NAD(P)H-dependent oxidoreductase [Piscinibacter sp.]
MSELRLLVLSGSERQGSFNKRLAAAAGVAAERAGAQVALLDLRALGLPLYDGDLEKSQGVPGGARTLRDALLASDAMLLSTPEYNGFPPPLVINSFDWLSRLAAEDGKPSGLATTANKPVGLLAASPGLLGGLRSLNFTRQYVSMAFAMLPVPQQFALAKAGEAFDEQGALKDPKQQAAVDGVIASLLRVATALKTG